jgi:dipeptidyl aminopeptidase/acylaminoacyl peptidase
MARPRPFRPADAMRQVMIQGIALSPDGETIVYTRRSIEKGVYRSRLWRVPFGGGRPEQLTSADANDGRPRFSPDGRALAFISDRKDDKPQAWTIPLGGGEPRVLAELPDGIGAVEWSPDGASVLLVAPSGDQRFVVGKKDDPVARQIRDYVWRVDGAGVRDQNAAVWVAPAGGRGTPRRVTRSGFNVEQAFWSPDGSRIGFLADTRPDLVEAEIPQAWSIPVGGGRERPLGSLPGGVWSATWDRPAFVAVGITRADPMGWERLVLHVKEGRVLSPIDDGLEEETVAPATYGDLVDPEGEGAAPVWLDDRTIAAIVSRRGRQHVYSFGTDRTIAALTEGDVVCSALAASAGHVAVVANLDAGPGDVYAVEPGRRLRRVTTDGARWFGPFRREVEQVVARHPEGHEVEGWLLRARGKQKAALVLDVHGGPYAAHSPVPWLEMLCLSDAGFHVLWTNPRGSSGYGENFGRAVAGAWGVADSSDQLLLVDRLIRRGLTDRKRVGIMGLSYGGYMTHRLLGHAPGRFAAAVSENPVTDLIAEFGAADFGTDIGKTATGMKLPSDSFQAWLDGSPYTKIHLNHAPLLLLQSDQDLRCPPVNSELPFAILKSLGREVEMIRYPQESHIMFIIGRPDRRVDRLERIVGWFRQHLR